MDNAQKAIMIGVGLFITIIVIAAVMLITGIGQDMLNSGTNQLSGVSEQMKASTLNTYDQKIFPGQQAKEAADNVLNLNQGYIVKIVNKTGTVGTYTTPANATTGKAPASPVANTFYKGESYKADVSGTTITFTKK